MNPVPEDRLLLVGRVVQPHGLRGLLKIFAYAGSDAAFVKAKTVFLRPQDGECREFTLNFAHPAKSRFIVKLGELSSLADAEKYRGADILVEMNALPAKEEDEYFWYELMGMDVFLESGEYLGFVSHIMATGSNDIYVVSKGTGEVLIPATHEIVREIDLKLGKMVVRAVEGLLDLNEI